MHFFPRPGDHDIPALRKRPPYRLVCPAPHDDRVAGSGFPKMLHIFGNMPQQGVVPAYGSVVGDRRYYTFFHYPEFVIPLREPLWQATDRIPPG